MLNFWFEEAFSHLGMNRVFSSFRAGFGSDIRPNIITYSTTIAAATHGHQRASVLRLLADVKSAA